MKMKKKNLSASSSSTTTTTTSPSSLLSSSSSSSTFSSLSFDPTIMCSSKKATAGCLTGILRRILCSRGLPTHPSDQITDQNQNHPQFMINHNHKNKILTSSSSSTAITLSSSPGIVPRLMGLESMVEKVIPTESSSVTTSTLSRSRSMNSVECFGECDRMQGIHRRVKSSLSYRDVPDFLLFESDNFLVLSFETKLGGSAKSKQQRQQRKLKENRREKVSQSDMEKKKEQSRKVFDEMPLRRKNDGNGKMMLLREVTNTMPLCSSQNNKYADSETEEFEEVLNGGKNLERRRRRRKKKKKKKTSCNCNCNCSANNNNNTTKVECNSEDSSPVSVLDFDRQVPDSEADSLGVILSWRRKLSPEAGNDQNFELRFDGNLMVEQRNMNMNMKGNSSKRKEKQREEYLDIWDEACRKAEDELIESNEIWKQGDWESIGEDFESQIFDHLLTDLIGQLVTLK